MPLEFRATFINDGIMPAVLLARHLRGDPNAAGDLAKWLHTSEAKEQQAIIQGIAARDRQRRVAACDEKILEITNDLDLSLNDKIMEIVRYLPAFCMLSSHKFGDLLNKTPQAIRKCWAWRNWIPLERQAFQNVGRLGTVSDRHRKSMYHRAAAEDD